MRRHAIRVLFATATACGTAADPASAPNESHLEVGAEVYGGGGYLDADSLERIVDSDAVEIHASCVDNEYGEVAVVNNFDGAVGAP